MELPEGQKAAINRAIGRATRNSSLEIIQEGESVRVRIERPGDDGYQVMESTIDVTGNKVNVQMAFNALETLVHYDPKTPVSSEVIQEALRQMKLPIAQLATANLVIGEIPSDASVDITKRGKLLIIRSLRQGRMSETVIDVKGEKTVTTRNL